jgi:hypothetical protein
MSTRDVISWALCGTIAVGLLGFVLLGGDEDSAGGEAEAARTEIERMLSRTFTENDPAQCSEDATSDFLRQGFGGEGEDPLEECRRENTEDEEPDAESVQIDSVIVDGATARAVFTASGGGLDGSVVTVELVHDFDRWKLDRMTDIQIDRARFDAALREDAANDEGTTAREADCFVAALGRYDTSALERLTLQGPEGNTAFRRLALSCLSPARMVRVFTKGLREKMDAGDIPEPAVDCITDSVVRSLGVKGIRELAAAGQSAIPSFAPQLDAALFACMDAYRSGLLGKAGRS